MASRPIFSPYPVITNGDMSQATITSKVTVIQNLSMISYDFSWSGTSPVGTIVAQVSNTFAQAADGTTSVAGSWTTLPSTSLSVSGNTGNGLIDVTATGAYAVRLLYTKSSGTGTLQATISGKVA